MPLRFRAAGGRPGAPSGPVRSRRRSPRSSETSAIGADDELVLLHALAPARFGDQPAGMPIGLCLGNAPAHDSAAEDADDRAGGPVEHGQRTASSER